MIRKIVLLTAFLILPLFTISCFDNASTDSGNSSVVLNFDGLSKVTSIEGIPVTQKSTISKALPAGVTSIRIKVYSGTEADGTVFDQTLPVTDTLTVEIPSGLARIFKVYALNSSGVQTHSAVSTPIDLVGGEDISLALSLSEAVANASFSVKLLADDGVSDFADPDYLASSGDKFTANVYKPTINNTDPANPEVDLGAIINTVSSTSFVTSLSGLNAYAATPQIVIVRAFTLDGTIAAIGIAAFADLSDGTNSTPVPVVMSRPGRLIITNDTPITDIEVKLSINESNPVVATNGVYKDPYTIIVSVPNNRGDIGSLAVGGTSNFTITINGSTKSYSAEIGWVAKNIDFKNL